LREAASSFNTIPPTDFSYFEMVNELVQMEPATSFNSELLGQLAAIGIVKGKPFSPDARMKKILIDAAAVGNAAGRMNWRAADYPGWAYYENSSWASMLWQGGYTFETPPPMVTKEGIEPLPPTGAWTLDLRTAFDYGYTTDTPAMIMRLTNVGSQYLMGFTDADKNPFDGAKTYKVTLPKDIPVARFWSLTLYDNQTRSMLQAPQRSPVFHWLFQDARTYFFYMATVNTPAMAVRIPGRGAQYALRVADTSGKEFDGAKSYRVNIPANVPAQDFWSMVVYDPQTRSELQTPQPYPSKNNKRDTLITNADGSVDLYFGPKAPAGKEANWTQTVPSKGWFAILRLYGPLDPWFEKTWRPGEIEEVK
jgi:hypothetical protein